jgi:hypothetical protein
MKVNIRVFTPYYRKREKGRMFEKKRKASGKAKKKRKK